ncbi:MAG: hypothetical protein P8Y23_07240 [Candidatus Lokiarchaeota archaeon]|jgi:transposase-like protein
MKNHRKIIIIDPKLQRIRNSLRKLLLLSLYSEEERIPLKDIQLKNKLNRLIDNSILRCSACNHIYENMQYNKKLDRWYCVACYGSFHDSFFEYLKRKSRGEFLGDINWDFYRAFQDKL